MAQQTRDTQALLEARARELFDRMPPVLGFSFDEDLAAVELAAEDPHGEDLLRGRTFARSLH